MWHLSLSMINLSLCTTDSHFVMYFISYSWGNKGSQTITFVCLCTSCSGLLISSIVKPYKYFLSSGSFSVMLLLTNTIYYYITMQSLLSSYVARIFHLVGIGVLFLHDDVAHTVFPQTYLMGFSSAFHTASPLSPLTGSLCY